MNLTRREALATSTKALFALPIGAALFSQSGCGKSGLITALDVAAVAATGAIPVIEAFSVQLGPLAPLAVAYAKGIANACAESVTELGTSDPQSVQYTDIANYFLSVASPALPAGTVAEVAAVISAIGYAVQIILNAVKSVAALKATPPNPAGQTLLAKYQADVKALGSDKARLADIMNRAASVGK